MFPKSWKIILPGLPFLTYSNTTSIWKCLPGYVTLNLNLTYSSNRFPPCTYLLETGVKDAIEQWREWDSIQFLRLCIIIRLVTGPINISDNQNRFKPSWAITIQLWQNTEIPILEFTMDNDNLKVLFSDWKKWKNANSYLYYRKQNALVSLRPKIISQRINWM